MQALVWLHALHRRNEDATHSAGTTCASTIGSLAKRLEGDIAHADWQ